MVPERKQAINGRCLKRGYRLAWVLVLGKATTQLSPRRCLHPTLSYIVLGTYLLMVPVTIHLASHVEIGAIRVERCRVKPMPSYYVIEKRRRTTLIFPVSLSSTIMCVAPGGSLPSLSSRAAWPDSIRVSA